MQLLELKWRISSEDLVDNLQVVFLPYREPANTAQHTHPDNQQGQSEDCLIVRGTQSYSYGGPTESEADIIALHDHAPGFLDVCRAFTEVGKRRR